jgi:hypothetical protein
MKYKLQLTCNLCSVSLNTNRVAHNPKSYSKKKIKCKDVG